MTASEAIFFRPTSRRHFLTTSALVAGGTLGAGALLEACGGAGSSTPAGTTQLVFLVPGSAPTGWNTVLTAVNKKLQSDGTSLSLKFEWISWANYVNTILLKVTAGDKFDGVLTALWAHLEQFISDKSILPLDSYVARAPHLLATIPDKTWNANKFNGKIMAVPMGSSFQSIQGFAIRKDLRLKYGFDPLKSYADIEKFMYMVKAKEKGVVPYGFSKYDTSKTFNTYNWDTVPVNFHTVNGNNTNDYAYVALDKMKVVPIWEYTGYTDALQRIHKYVQDGIISQDSLNITGQDMQDLFEQGQFAVAPTVTDGTMFPPKPMQVSGAELEIVYPYTQPNPKPLNGFIMWNFVAVNARSAHPDKVIALLDWLSIKENHDLLEYGIQGKDWKAVSASAYTALTDYPTTFPGFAISWRPSLERVSNAMLPDSKQWYEFASNPDNFTLDPIGSFNFNTVPVSAQISQLSAAQTQYQVPLEHGVVDPVKGLAQMQQAYKQSGYDQVLAEMQKQVDAFVANKKS